MADNENRQEHHQSQHPALIIGLGGTGKQVLLNLRRMFFERYGKATLPHVAHLWIDTDTRNITLDGKEVDFLMQEVNFKEHEKLSVELSRSDLTDYYDHPDAYPHIFSWFDSRLQKLGEVRNGAGAVRSFGRLAFFHYYEDIKQRIIEKRAELEKATSHTEARDEHGVTLDNSSVDVWIAFSIAGGTGSGMFLDMAFAIRELWQKNVNIRGLIVLPTVFSNDYTERVYANSYAALMELEHYSFDKDDVKSSRDSDGLHRFPHAWTKQQFSSGSRGLRGPVFDTAYIIDNKPKGSGGMLALDDKDSLCKMLAEWLYIEYASGKEVEPLAGQRRSAESNFAVSQLRPIRYNYDAQGFQEVFSSRFSTLGLSKIHIPVHRTHISVQYRLARDMVEFWSSPRDIPANLDEKIEKEFLHKLRIDNSTKHLDLVRALEMGDDSERLSNRLRKKVIENRKQFIGMVGSGDVRNRIEQWVDNSLIREQLEYSNAQKERNGALSKTISNNREKHYDQVKSDLHDFVAEIVGEPAYRFEVARETLRRIRDRLTKDSEHFTNVSDRNRNRSNHFVKETQKRLEWLDDVSGNFSRKILIEVALDMIEKRAETELKAQVANNAADLAQSLANFIGHGHTETNAQGEEVLVESGLLRELQILQDRLRNEMLYQLNDRLQSFNQPDTSTIFQDLGKGLEEADQFYVDQKNNPITKGTLAEWEKDFFEKQTDSGPKSLWKLKDSLDTEGASRVIERLVEFGRNTMYYLRDNKVDVVDRLSTLHTPGSDRYNAIVQRLIDYSQPWLSDPIHHIDRAQIRSNRKKAYWVARKNNPGSENVNQLERYFNDNRSTVNNWVSTSPDRIYAASEVAGLPLMVIPGLDNYRNQSYYEHLRAGEVIHTDVGFEKFQDLLVKETDEVESYTYTLKLFIQAILLGIIQIDQNKGQQKGDVLEFEYVDRRDLYSSSMNLGPFTVAIQTLSRNNLDMQDTLEDIKSQADNILGDMTDIAVVHWYTLLQYHAEDPRSFFYRFASDHAIRVQLRNIAKDVERKDPSIKDDAIEEIKNIKNWSVERPKGSGMRILQED